MKPIYGLCDAGDLLFQSLGAHYRRELAIEPMTCDPSLYVATNVGILQRFSGTFVEDLLRAGNNEFNEKAKKISHCFGMAQDKEPTSRLPGSTLHNIRITFWQWNNIDTFDASSHCHPMLTSQILSHFEYKTLGFRVRVQT